jgi:ABC-type oligopeptide transport system ATPase subunit
LKNIIEVKGLIKYFKTESLFSGRNEIVKAVDDVSFDHEAGKILAIVGESGSGKTTVARCIAGLLPPDSGKITFEENNIDFSNKETRRKIQYVFQDTYSSLNPRIRVGAAIEEPIKFHFKPAENELRNEALKCLEDVGLSAAILEKYPHELSGGQRQRVVIARALAMKPEVLIADEPVSSLDVSVQAQILKLFIELNNKGISIIFITHDLRIVKNLADEIIIMQNGKIVEMGIVEKIYRRPATEYTRLLLSSIPNSPYKFIKP